MKTNSASLWISLIALALTGLASFAQDENSTADNTSYEASDATTVVYDAPVAYYASVVYQSPVIYNAPVFFVAAATVAVNCVTQAQAQPAEPASTVCVIGGSGGAYCYANGDSTCAASTVVQFGERGGWFGSQWPAVSTLADIGYQANGR
jgi:hypothetical protein